MLANLHLPLAPELSLLAVGFITPGFAVAGVLAISIPIIIHLLNRRKYKILNWAAMQFLLAAMRKNRRRIKFEQWILLATRCALLALLGLALARPLGCADSSLANLAGRSSALHVIVLDNSYSMAYQADRPDALTHFDQAKKMARQLIDRLSSGGESVVLITASQPAQPILGKPSYDLRAVGAAIERVEQRYTGTDLAGALAMAEQVGREEVSQPTKFLHIFSDATSSAWRDGNEKTLAALAPKLAANFKIQHYNLSVPAQSNAAVLAVAPASNLVRTRFANDFKAVARSYGASIESSILWKRDDATLPGGTSVPLDAQKSDITLSNAEVKTGGATVISAALSVDDRLKIDNTRYHTVDVANEMKILIVEGKRGMGPLDGSGAFLDLALAPPVATAQAGRTTDSYIKPERISDIELGGRPLGEYRAIMLADVAQLASPVADQLTAYVKQGGTVVWFMGEQVSRESYNTTLLTRGLIPGALTQRQTGPNNQGFTFAFNPTANNHPLLTAFGNVDKSGLDTAQVFTYWQITPKEDLRVDRVLNFRAPETAAPGAVGDAAITMHTLGDGRIVFFASSANAEWTSFPAKPAYVSLMHEIIAGSVAGSERWMNLEVGQKMELPAALTLAGTPTLRDPGGAQDTPLDQITRPDGSTFYQSKSLDKPGVYRLNTGNASIPISVNVPAAEADIRPIPDDALRGAMANVDMQFLGAELPGLSGASEEANDFGWSLMMLVLVLLGVECFMAMRFGHYRRGGATVLQPESAPR